MAEIVQYHLEQMVGELEDLERKGLFTRDEIRMVVKRRTKFEYNLRRRKVQRADFLRYIEYEINVDALRRQRKQRQGQKAGKISQSDYSIVQRIISIFERALIRHAEDTELWLQYIEFIKSRRRLGERGIGGADDDDEGDGHSRLLSRLFARAIGVHPYEPQMWIKAAAHELDVNANGGAARVLLQRALRLNPECTRLWIEYFRLELLLVEKIKARRRVLGIDGTQATTDDAVDGSEEAGAAIDLPLLEEEDERTAVEERFAEKALARHLGRGGEELSEEQRVSMAQQDNAYLQGAVAQVVFEQAIRAVPKSLSFRQELAAVASQYADMESLRQRVLDSVAVDFASNAQARAYLCATHLSSVSTESPELVDALQEAVKKYAATLGELDTPEMWTAYVGFLTQWQDACGGDSEDGVASLRTYFATLLSRAVKAIGEQRATRLDAQLALVCANAIESADGDIKSWLADATQRFPDSADLWHKRLSALLDDNSSRVERLFMDQALVHVPQSRKLWELWADWIERRFTEGQLSTNGVQAQYMAAFARVTQHRAAYATREDGDGAATLVAVVAKLQVRYIDWAWSLPQAQKLGDFNAISSGHAMDEDSDDDEAPTAESGEAPKDQAGGNVDALRQAYRNVQRHAFPTPPFFRRCIALEPDTPRRIDLHEMACRVDGSDVKPWLAHLRFLVDAKQMTHAVNVFRRASNAVPENQLSELESSYQNLLHKDN